MQLEIINAILAEDMLAVNRTIESRLRSEVALINQLSHYIVGSGGKRLRPQLVLLAARAVGYAGEQHVEVAAIIELVHTATLLHDDVVDDSSMRRGQDSANAVWGNEAAVLVGDYLYSRAFEMMVDVGNMRVMEILAHTTNTIAQGEVMQLLNVHDPDTSEEQYLEVIRSKTARLFQAATQLGGVLAGVEPALEEALADYGLHIGMAFQLIDDVLDYSASAHTLGKNVGDDLAEGKPTLPLILALERAPPETVRLLREAIEQGTRDDVQPVLDAVLGSGAIDVVRARARAEADAARAALDLLPAGEYTEALRSLTGFAIERDH